MLFDRGIHDRQNDLYSLEYMENDLFFVIVLKGFFLLFKYFSVLFIKSFCSFRLMYFFLEFLHFLQLFLLFMSFSLAVEALHAFIQDESEHKYVKSQHNLSVIYLVDFYFLFDIFFSIYILGQKLKN